MGKFIVMTHVTVSCYTKVEADNEEEALRIAGERQIAQMPYINWEYDEEDSWVVDDFDGEPDFDLMSAEMDEEDE